MPTPSPRPVSAAPSLDDARLPAGQIARIAAIEEDHFWFAGRLALVERLVRRHAPEGAALLDAGCGTGRTAARLGALGYRVSAADLSEDGVAAAAARGVDAVRADGRDLPFADASFDALLLLDVLEHTDDVAALREAARVLVPGGFVLLTVPACPRLWSARDEVAGHLRRYTGRTLASAVEASGMALDDLGRFGTLLFPAFVLSRLASRVSPGALEREERQPGWLSRPLRSIAVFEARLAGVVHLPYGSSLYAVCRRT